MLYERNEEMEERTSVDNITCFALNGCDLHSDDVAQKAHKQTIEEMNVSYQRKLRKLDFTDEQITEIITITDTCMASVNFLHLQSGIRYGFRLAINLMT